MWHPKIDQARRAELKNKAKRVEKQTVDEQLASIKYRLEKVENTTSGGS